jgi:hypothetical protein
MGLPVARRPHAVISSYPVDVPWVVAITSRCVRG